MPDMFHADVSLSRLGPQAGTEDRRAYCSFETEPSQPAEAYDAFDADTSTVRVCALHHSLCVEIFSAEGWSTC